MRWDMWLKCLCITTLVAGVHVFVAWGQDGQSPVAALDQAKRDSAAYVRAFNSRDAAALKGLFTADTDFAFLQGPSAEQLEYGMVCGRGELVNCYAAFFSTFPDSRLTQTVLSARLIRPDLYIADVDFEIKNLPRNDGPIRGRAVTIHVKEAGGWKIAAERNVSRTPLRAAGN